MDLKIIIKFTFILFMLHLNVSFAQNLNFAAHPVHYPERQTQVFTPLVDYLSKETGQNIKLLEFRNYHRFWGEIKKRTDIHLVFAEPHIAAYIMRKNDYIPLVVSIEPTQYELLTLDESIQFNQLKGRKIASLPSPSLGNILLDEWHPNPLQRPSIVATARDWQDTIDMTFAEETVAAMVPKFLAEMYPNLTSVKSSDTLPGLTLLASEEVSEDLQAKIVDAMTGLSADAQYLDILTELHISGFQAANEDDFDDLHKLLKNTFGY